MMTVLARRFSIVCLIAAGFGIAVAGLVQETTRPAHSVGVERSLPCVFELNGHCGYARR